MGAFPSPLPGLPGDDDFERIVIEAPEDGPRVLIRTEILGFEHPPTEWIESDRLIRLPSAE